MRHSCGILLLLACWAAAARGDDNVCVKDGWFHVGGEPFFVKGVCFFENHNVDGVFARSSLDVLDHEFARIKAAGFNTIRSQLRSEELALARRHGLMVMQGANHLCFSKEYEDPAVVSNLVRETRDIVRDSRDFDNVLCYLIDNEPQVQEGLYRQGARAAEDLYRLLIGVVKEEDPGAIVSMASYPPAAMLDHSIFDCVSLNLYPGCPACDSMGYRDYAAWFKRRHAAGRPLLISEYGWTVSRQEDQMGRAMMDLLDEQIAAGACGSFFFTWRAFGPEAGQDNLWYGIVPNQGRPSDHTNAPRALLHDLRRYFTAVVIEPRKDAIYSGRMPVRVCVSDDVGAVRLVHKKQVVDLERDGPHWWKAEIEVKPDYEGQRDITIEARDKDGVLVCSKVVPVVFATGPRLLNLRIVKPRRALRSHELYEARILALDYLGRPLADVDLRLGLNQTGKDLWASELITGRTDRFGKYVLSMGGLAPGFFTLMAGSGVTGLAVNVSADAHVVRIDP